MIGLPINFIFYACVLSELSLWCMMPLRIKRQQLPIDENTNREETQLLLGNKRYRENQVMKKAFFLYLDILYVVHLLKSFINRRKEDVMHEKGRKVQKNAL